MILLCLRAILDADLSSVKFPVTRWRSGEMAAPGLLVIGLLPMCRVLLYQLTAGL